MDPGALSRELKSRSSGEGTGKILPGLRCADNNRAVADRFWPNEPNSSHHVLDRMTRAMKNAASPLFKKYSREIGLTWRNGPNSFSACPRLVRGCGSSTC